VIAWEESGSGRPLVLVHGLTEDRRNWDLVVPLLEDGFRCVRLDLRGHGQSSDAGDYSALAMAEDVATVVAEAGIAEAPLLLGHSLGAVVVSAYAAGGAPAAGVINVDQSLRLGDFAAGLQPLGDALRGAGFHDAVLAVFDALGTAALDDASLAYVTDRHEKARQDVVLGVWSLVLESEPAALTAIAEGLLGALAGTPYLAVHGSDLAPGYEAWLTGLLPGATVEVWDGGGHYPHLAEPERFAARVRAFAAAD
jgi:pimeloyl-ACP methyl ester carboxylesterase